MKSLMKAIVLFYCLIIYQLALAGVSVNISPSSIHLGETFYLTLTLDAMQNRAVPDLVPLLKEFDIVGTERNMSYTVINGQARALSQWHIILKPKKSGTLIIPPIQIGQEQSLASQVVVQASVRNQIESDEAPDNSLFIASANNTKPYIHQQIIYTVRLLTRQRLLDAQYHPPQVEDALLMPLGDGRHYQTQFKGQSYEVEEQQYAVFPQREGKLTISPPALDAMALGDFGPSRIRLAAKPLSLTVSALPADQSIKNWLPASAVTLEESYDHDDPQLLEGDTVVRTITIKTKDLAAQLLPSLTFNNTTAYHIYKEKPTIENHIEQDALWGSTTIQLTYLLSQSGQTILPAIHIPWFNTTTHRQEIASLPERTLAVRARAGGAHTSPHSVSSSKNQLITPTSPASKYSPTTIFWATITLISIIGLGFFLWYQYQRKQPLQPKNIDKMISFKKACKINDPYQTRIALLQWASTQWPDRSILNLHDIPIQDHAFKTEIARLSQALYAPIQSVTWTGEALWHCICAFKTPAAKKKHKLDLPPMNPTVVKE